MATRKPKEGDAVRLDGQDGTVLALQNIRGLPEARLNLPGKLIDCAAADLKWAAEEGFWYLPQRVTARLPNRYGPGDKYTADITNHPHYAAGRDDLAVEAVEQQRAAQRGG